MSATYPEKANPEQQSEMRGFLKLLSKLYPCWVCADDFRTWMAEPSGKNEPKLGGRKEFGNWMCEAHNEVNRKLGKKEFDCRFWEERWRTGWKDGRCD
jgi:FAD-linked sulfhydryl oxidase